MLSSSPAWHTINSYWKCFGNTFLQFVKLIPIFSLPILNALEWLWNTLFTFKLQLHWIYSARTHFKLNTPWCWSLCWSFGKNKCHMLGKWEQNICFIQRRLSKIKMRCQIFKWVFPEFKKKGFCLVALRKLYSWKFPTRNL